MIAENDVDLYGKKQIRLPQPEFIIAYNGYKHWKEKYLKLSTMFPERITAPSGTRLELTVKIVNIKPDSDDIEIPEGSELYVYSTLVDKIEYYRRRKGSTNKDAFRLAYEYCMKKGLKSEIFDRWEELYMNFDKYFSLEWQWKREGYEEGVERGIEKGMEKGIEKGKLKGKLETAGNMRKAGISLEQISTFINIPIQELEQYEL
jgi:predicted transposase/invertase (TIGR01784 family)